MTRKISKSNGDLAFFNSRIDEIRMSGHARLKAKAHLAQAEAMADFVVGTLRGIARLFKHESAHPHRPAASAG